MNLYKDIMFGRSPLHRYQREMLAVVVSATNKCEYCIRHHREALFHYWKSYEKIDLLYRQPEAAGISDDDAENLKWINLLLTPDLLLVERARRQALRQYILSIRDFRLYQFSQLLKRLLPT